MRSSENDANIRTNSRSAAPREWHMGKCRRRPTLPKQRRVGVTHQPMTFLVGHACLTSVPPALGPVPFWNSRTRQNPGNRTRPSPLNRDPDGMNGGRHGARPSWCDVFGPSSPRDRVRAGDPRHQVGASSGRASDAGAFAPASRIVPLVVRSTPPAHLHRPQKLALPPRRETLICRCDRLRPIGATGQIGWWEHDIRTASDIDRHRY